MKYRTAELATGIFFFIFSVFYTFYLTPNFIVNPLLDTTQSTMPWTLRPEMLPHVTIGSFAIMSLGLIVHALRSNDEAPFDFHFGPSLKLIFLILLTYIYVYLLQIIGFILLTPAFLIALILLFGIRDWRMIIGVSLLLPLFLNYGFLYLFQLILPEGSLWS
jgi:hypothetical protein